MTKPIFSRLALLLSLVCLALAQGDGPVLSCDSPILNKLRSASGQNFSDVFYDTPQVSSSEICKLQWGINQTCCKPERVTALVEHLFTAWKNRIDNFIKKLDTIEKDIVPRAENAGLRISDLLTKVNNNREKLSSDRIDPALVTRAEEISTRSALLTEQINPENFARGKTEFLKNIKDCFETIKVFRAGALCGICSGNSAAFLSEGKPKITQDTCVKITGSCAKSWQFMFETMRNLKSIQTASKIEQAISATGSAPKITDTEITRISPEAEENLIEDLRTVSTMRPEAVTFNSFVERICKSLLTVDSEPNPYIDGDVTTVETVI